MGSKPIRTASTVALTILTGLCFILSSSCKSAATEADRKKLQELRSVYANRYEFELEEGLYVKAKSLIDKQPNKDEGMQIYRSFWFEGQSPRTTNYVYLNIFNKDGDFQFQVYWESKKNDFGFSQRPYY
jgi:hypothetical protein